MSTKRNQTNPDAAHDWTLREQQQTAVDLLVTGKTLQDTADLVGVQRPTVSNWINYNAVFQASLNRRRQELWRELVEGLRALAPRALAVLEAELEGETPLAAAVHVLKSIGLYGAALPAGPTTPEEIAAHMQIAADLRQHAQAEATISERDYERALHSLMNPTP